MPVRGSAKSKTSRPEGPPNTPSTRRAPAGRLPKAEVDLRVERLLQIALQQFAKHGFEATSLDRLVELSGVSKTTIIRRFGSKEGMFRVLMDQNVAAIRAEVWSMSLDPDDPQGTLERVAEGLVESAVSDPLGNALFRLAIAEKDNFPGLGATLMLHADEGLAPLGAYFALLMERGVIKPADPREIAYDFLALTSHGFRSFLNDRAYLHRPGRGAEIARRFLKGWS